MLVGNPLSCLDLQYAAALSAREQGWQVDVSDSKSQGILTSNTSGEGKQVYYLHGTRLACSYRSNSFGC